MRLRREHFGVAVALGMTAFAAQIAVWRVTGGAIPATLVASLALATLAPQLALALLFAGRRRERTWSMALLLVPMALALLAFAERWAGVMGVVALVLATGGGITLASRQDSRAGRPFACGLLGIGAALCLAGLSRGTRLEGRELHAPQQTALAIILGAMLVLAWRLDRTPETRLPALRRSLSAALAALLVGGVLAATSARPRLSAPSGSVTSTGPSVVLVVLDTVRADHLADYGHEIDTMPELARFARRHAVRVERALVNAPSSLESHGSMFTGLLPFRHGGHKPSVDDPDPPGYGYPLSPDVPTLAELLGRSGYWTVGLSANHGPLGPAFGFGRGFAHYDAEPDPARAFALVDPWRIHLHRRWPLAAFDDLWPFSSSGFFEPPMPYRRAEAMVDEALRVVDLAGERAFFLFLNLFDAHDPNRPPRAQARLLPDTPRPGLSAFADDQHAVRALMQSRQALPRAVSRRVEALYGSELLYMDGELARLLERLERHPRFDEMLIIVTSDHGEALGDHLLFGHSTSLYDETLRVPLYVKPGRRRPAAFQAPGVVPGPVQGVDLFATILDHAGVPEPPGIDGRAWGTDRTASVAEAYVFQFAVRQYGARFRRQLWMVEREDWKLIRSSNGEQELYDLSSDPEELDDRATREATRLAGLDRLLAEHFDPARGGTAPLEVAPSDDETHERLRALGYVE